MRSLITFFVFWVSFSDLIFAESVKERLHRAQMEDQQSSAASLLGNKQASLQEEDSTDSYSQNRTLDPKAYQALLEIRKQFPRPDLDPGKDWFIERIDQSSNSPEIKQKMRDIIMDYYQLLEKAAYDIKKAEMQATYDNLINDSNLTDVQREKLDEIKKVMTNGKIDDQKLKEKLEIEWGKRLEFDK